LFRRLDWLAAFRFVGLNDLEEYRHLDVTPESAAEAVQLVELDGRIYGGFEAVRRVLEVLPLTFLWAPYLALRPVRAVGDEAYRALAVRRTCQIAHAP
jgi:predicted DCC family thiol-disulfide oxidoreductase YuxK